MAVHGVLFVLSELPKKKRDAITLGVTYYFTGLPCKNGHVDKRHVGRGCIQCHRDWKKAPHGKSLKRAERQRWLERPGGKAYKKRKSIGKRLKVRQAIPSWHDPAPINQFISGCPPGHHIDHIVPLRGRNVCGLHVLVNLQYLPSQENLSKSNKVDPLTLDYAICVLPGHRTYTHG